MITVRKFNIDDMCFIVDKWLGTDRLDGIFQNAEKEKIEELISIWEKEVDDKGDFYLGFCIEKEGVPIGIIMLSENIKGIPTFGIAIDIDYRGRGYGKQASMLVFEELKQRGYKLLKSSCRQNNIASKKLHEKLGFQLIKSELSPNGTPMYRWEKRIV